MIEEWKLIDTKEVLEGGKCRIKRTRNYYVSNLGRCRINDKIIEWTGDEKNYYVFHGKRVHVWVALMFIPNPDNKKEIDHIDTNIHNNRVDNLHWVTHKENANNPITKIRFSESMLNQNISDRTKKQWEDKRDIMVEAIHNSQPKRTESLLKVMKTKKYHDNMSITQKGRKWINNGVQQKKLFPNEIEEYLNNGWKYGMLTIK